MTTGVRSISEPRARSATYLGVLVVTLATLMYQVGLTRLFSATTWYHFAFVAVSVAMFGMTIGAMLVHLLPDRFPRDGVKRQMAWWSVLFGIAIMAATVVQLAINFSPEWTVAGVASVVVTCLVISVPFVCSGIVVALALTRFRAQVNRVYAVDLIGAAFGGAVLVLLLQRMDGPSALVVVGAIAAIGGLAFAIDGGVRAALAVALVALLAFGTFAALNASRSADGDAWLRVRYTQGRADVEHDYEAWNVYSRVTVDGDPDVVQPVAGWGLSATMPPYTGRSMLLVIDSGAATGLHGYSGDPAETDFLRYDISNLAHHALGDADVLVIGAGGGRDVLSALEFDQDSVTAVEINGEILDVVNDRYGEFTGHLDRDPRVMFVNDEARSYVARTPERYDLIQISLIDTWAASAAGAYALSENSLYTTEAWDLFLDRLEPGGILSVSRWFELGGRESLETYRTAALASQTLVERGVENPREHILIYHGPINEAIQSNAATVLVSPEPFSAEALAAIDETAARLEFTPVLTSEVAIDDRYARIVAPGGPGPVVDKFVEDLSPPTDDRPFFLQMADLSTLLGGHEVDDLVTRPVVVLAVLALVVLALAALCIAVPAVLTRGHPRHPGMLPLCLYFGGIGFGFMLVEISQLQRLSIFLGHPVYALTVVLFALLVSSGLGSMLSERVLDLARPATLLMPLLVLLALVAAFGFATPGIISSAASATTPVRIAVAVGILFPLGLAMGMPFVIGMRAAGPDAPTAYLWGINGATSVCASVLAVALALFFGISVAFWAGGLAYVVAATSMAVTVRRRTAVVDITRAHAEEPNEPPVPAPTGGG